MVYLRKLVYEANVSPLSSIPFHLGHISLTKLYVVHCAETTRMVYLLDWLEALSESFQVDRSRPQKVWRTDWTWRWWRWWGWQVQESRMPDMLERSLAVHRLIPALLSWLGPSTDLFQANHNKYTTNTVIWRQNVVIEQQLYIIWVLFAGMLFQRKLSWVTKQLIPVRSTN